MENLGREQCNEESAERSADGDEEIEQRQVARVRFSPGNFAMADHAADEEGDEYPGTE